MDNSKEYRDEYLNWTKKNSLNDKALSSAKVWLMNNASGKNAEALRDMFKEFFERNKAYELYHFSKKKGATNENFNLATFEEWLVSEEMAERLDESKKLKHEIKSEEYWRSILKGNKYALNVLDTIMSRQNSLATDRQMEVLNRAKRGEKGPFSTKN